MSRGRSSFGASLAAFGLAALFAWAGSASAALSTTGTGPVASVDDRAPAAPPSVVAEANLVDLQGEVTWELSVEDLVRQAPVGSDFTSGGTFVRTNDVAGYQIWRSALGAEYELLDTVPAGLTSFTDVGVENGVPYVYAVTAVDAAGNASAPVESEEISFGPAGDAEIEVPEGSEPLAQTAVLEFSKPFDPALLVTTSVVYRDFVLEFRQLVASILGISIDRIQITSVLSGSTIVTFDILEDVNAGGESSADVMARLTAEVTADPTVFADAGLGSLLSYEATLTTKVEFGEVPADADDSTPLTFTNTSTDPDAILIVSTSVEGVGFSASPAKLTLRSGETGSIAIAFAAAAVGNVNGNYTGTLTIATNDPNSAVTVIELFATVVGGVSSAVADVSTQSISFPRITVDSFSSRELIVSNKGGLPLNITVSITGSDAFSLSDEGDLTLAGGESKTIEVVFAPATDTVFAATIDIHTDDAAHPHYAITVVGTGVPAGGPVPLIGPDGQEIFGDFDGDASVTFDDFFQFADNFGKTSADADFDEAFDLSGDGAVTFDDFFIFADNFGKSGTYASN